MTATVYAFNDDPLTRRAQLWVRSYAAQRCPDVPVAIVEGVVLSVGRELETDEALDVLDAEQLTWAPEGSV